LLNCRPSVGYARRPSLVLVNGLAEQAETWFRNLHAWRRHCDIQMPNILAYEGAALHRRIGQGLPITIAYLVDQLHLFLEAFVQAPPYQLVASSMGGKVAVEYAVRYPEEVSRLVLICPSGVGEVEQLPVVEGVRRNDLRSLVESVFFDPGHADPDVVRYYQGRFSNRRWRLGLLRTIRGTMSHGVRDLLPRVVQPTLLISGQEDRIVDPEQAAAAARQLPCGQFLLIPRCGHAPQIEKARLINRLVMDFLRHPCPEPGSRVHAVP